MNLLRSNSLSLVLFGVFVASLSGHYVTGWAEFNEEREAHGEVKVALAAYFKEGHFLQTLFENWESEFLQMGAYVLLTVFLFQKDRQTRSGPA